MHNLFNHVACLLKQYAKILRYGEISSPAILSILQYSNANITRPRPKLDNSILLVSDLRPQLLVAAFKLSRESRNVQIVLSCSIVLADYGDNVHSLLRLFIVVILKIFRLALVLPCSSFEKIEQVELLPVFSSLVSITCDARATQSSYPLLFHRFCQIASGCKNLMTYCVSAFNFSNIIVFNGRTAGNHYFANYARRNLIPLFFTEFGRGFNGFRLLSESPHSPGNNAREVIRIYEELTRMDPFIIRALLNNSKTYIREKLNNEFSLDYNSEPGQDFDVVIFAGSDHEYIYTDPIVTGIQSSSNLELAKFAFDRYPMLRHCLRIHPNSVKNDCSFLSQVEDIVKLAREQCIKLTVIHEPYISSYSLIKSSSHVVVQYSTIAIDSIFLGVLPVFQFKECDSSLMLDYALNFIPGDDFTVAEKVAALTQLQEFAYFVPFNYLERGVARVLFFTNLFLNKLLPF